ncbi:hypothetical protein HK405_008791, partial [Cladochytrium tenue]
RGYQSTRDYGSAVHQRVTDILYMLASQEYAQQNEAASSEHGHVSGLVGHRTSSYPFDGSLMAADWVQGYEDIAEHQLDKITVPSHVNLSMDEDHRASTDKVSNIMFPEEKTFLQHEDAMFDGGCDEYSSEIIDYMVEVESNSPVSPYYMKNQTEITWKMRRELVTKLMGIHSRFNLRPETLYLTVHYIDRVCSTQPVGSQSFALLGLTALWVAAKYEENHGFVPRLSALSSALGDCTFEKASFVAMEDIILRSLHFALGVPTPEAFLRIECRSLIPRPKAASGERRVLCAARALARLVMELTLLHKRFLSYRPRQIARASVHLAEILLHIAAPYDPACQSSPVHERLYQAACPPSPSHSLGGYEARRGAAEFSRLVRIDFQAAGGPSSSSGQNVTIVSLEPVTAKIVAHLEECLWHVPEQLVKKYCHPRFMEVGRHIATLLEHRFLSPHPSPVSRPDTQSPSPTFVKTPHMPQNTLHPYNPPSNYQVFHQRRKGRAALDRILPDLQQQIGGLAGLSLYSHDSQQQPSSTHGQSLPPLAPGPTPNTGSGSGAFGGSDSKRKPQSRAPFPRTNSLWSGSVSAESLVHRQPTGPATMATVSSAHSRVSEPATANAVDGWSPGFALHYDAPLGPALPALSSSTVVGPPAGMPRPPPPLQQQDQQQQQQSNPMAPRPGRGPPHLAHLLYPMRAASNPHMQRTSSMPAADLLRALLPSSRRTSAPHAPTPPPPAVPRHRLTPPSSAATAVAPAAASASAATSLPSSAVASAVHPRRPSAATTGSGAFLRRPSLGSDSSLLSSASTAAGPDALLGLGPCAAPAAEAAQHARPAPALSPLLSGARTALPSLPSLVLRLFDNTKAAQLPVRALSSESAALFSPGATRSHPQHRLR